MKPTRKWDDLNDLNPIRLRKALCVKSCRLELRNLIVVKDVDVCCTLNDLYVKLISERNGFRGKVKKGTERSTLKWTHC